MRERDPAGWIADRLTSARADVERIGRELVAKGHLTEDQVGAIATAVETAIERGRALVKGALREPKRVLDELRAAASSDDSTSVARAADASRIAALEERVAVLEQAVLHGRPRVRRGSEGD